MSAAGDHKASFGSYIQSNALPPELNGALFANFQMGAAQPTVLSPEATGAICGALQMASQYAFANTDRLAEYYEHANRLLPLLNLPARSSTALPRSTSIGPHTPRARVSHNIGPYTPIRQGGLSPATFFRSHPQAPARRPPPQLPLIQIPTSSNDMESHSDVHVTVPLVDAKPYNDNQNIFDMDLSSFVHGHSSPTPGASAMERGAPMMWPVQAMNMNDAMSQASCENSFLTAITTDAGCIEPADLLATTLSLSPISQPDPNPTTSPGKGGPLSTITNVAATPLRGKCKFVTTLSEVSPRVELPRQSVSSQGATCKSSQFVAILKQGTGGKPILFSQVYRLMTHRLKQDLAADDRMATQSIVDFVARERSACTTKESRAWARQIILHMSKYVYIGVKRQRVEESDGTKRIRLILFLPDSAKPFYAVEQPPLVWHDKLLLVAP